MGNPTSINLHNTNINKNRLSVSRLIIFHLLIFNKKSDTHETKTNLLNFLESLILLFFGFFTINAHAAISATTTNTIRGTAPFLTLDGGKTKITTTDSLLAITFPDGKTYSKINNPSSPSSPIQLPSTGQTLADISMLVPANTAPVSSTDPTQKVELKTLLVNPYSYWGSNDGDSDVTGTGTINLTITDVNGKKIERNAPLTDCSAPYKIVLTNTDSSLSTKYGYPRNTTYTADTVTYYVSPKIASPYTCWAQPNITQPYSDSTYTAWNSVKGFSTQSITEPSKNFPTTGANGLYFNLTVGGALGSDVVYTKIPENSGINITMQGTGNVAKITLLGPKSTSTQALAATAVPTTFILYSDKAKTNRIYSFTISKWYITKTGATIHYDESKAFCDGLGYNIPSVTDYTNANGQGWTGGQAGQGNMYQRRIGAGLFAEWGSTINNYYPGIEFTDDFYWSKDMFDSTQHYIISARSGIIGYLTSAGSARATCVKSGS